MLKYHDYERQNDIYINECLAGSSDSQYMASFVTNKRETDEPEANLNEQYHLLGGTMPVKVCFLHSHLDFIRPNFLGAVSKEIRECLQQDTEANE